VVNLFEYCVDVLAIPLRITQAMFVMLEFHASALRIVVTTGDEV
jgi:hypothetical protein